MAQYRGRKYFHGTQVRECGLSARIYQQPEIRNQKTVMVPIKNFHKHDPGIPNIKMLQPDTIELLL